jgi:hypothetical protein
MQQDILTKIHTTTLTLIHDDDEYEAPMLAFQVPTDSEPCRRTATLYLHTDSPAKATVKRNPRFGITGDLTTEVRNLLLSKFDALIAEINENGDVIHTYYAGIRHRTPLVASEYQGGTT